MDRNQPGCQDPSATFWKASEVNALPLFSKEGRRILETQLVRILLLVLRIGTGGSFPKNCPSQASNSRWSRVGERQSAVIRIPQRTKDGEVSQYGLFTSLRQVLNHCRMRGGRHPRPDLQAASCPSSLVDSLLDRCPNMGRFLSYDQGQEIPGLSLCEKGRNSRASTKVIL